MKINIFDIQRFSVHDGPGIRTVIFIKGCNLHCFWCQNPEGLEINQELMLDAAKCIGCLECLKICPNNAIRLCSDKLVTDRNICKMCGLCAENCYSGARVLVGKLMGVNEVYKIIERDKIFYDNSNGGVTISGGEPLVNWKFCYELFKKCKNNRINTALETSGLSKWENLEIVLKYVDYVLFDIKLTDPDKHKKYTGKSNKLILSNLIKTAKLKKSIVIRVPLIPNINDDDENLIKISEIARDLGIKEVHLMPYHELGLSKYAALEKKYLLTDADPCDNKIKNAKEILEPEGIKVRIGGLY